MKKTGKLLLIFGIIALVSAIAFGCTVAAFGVANSNYGIQLLGINIGGGLPMTNTGIIINDNDTRISYDFEKNKAYDAELDGTGLSDIIIDLASCRATLGCGDTNKISLTYTTSTYPVEFTAQCIDGVLHIKEHTSPLSFLSFGSFNELFIIRYDIENVVRHGAGQYAFTRRLLYLCYVLPCIGYIYLKYTSMAAMTNLRRKFAGYKE